LNLFQSLIEKRDNRTFSFGDDASYHVAYEKEKQMAYLSIILTIVFWGAGAFIGKAVLRDGSSIYTYLLEASGTLSVAGCVCLLFKGEALSVVRHFNGWGYLFGILWGLGTVTFIVALKLKPASIAVPLTALYPLATAVLAMAFLGEPLTVKTGAGIACAILAAVLLS
jgi:drug/metabolite transporter (DMT)-like permease